MVLYSHHMTKTFKYLSKNSKLISEDGHITIYLDNDYWVLDDVIENEIVRFKTKEEALEESANRMMISELGNFHMFMGDLKGNNDLVFKYQID